MSKAIEHREWSGKTGGLPWMQRWLVAILRHVDIRFVYIAMCGVIPFYLIFHHKEYLAIYHYFRMCHRYSIRKSFLYTLKNHYVFGQIIIDRFAAYGGRKFDISIYGYDKFKSLLNDSSGFIMISSHVGNYEIAGYSLVSENKSIHALVYAGETGTVMEYRNIMFKPNNIRMIPMSKDMSHLFAINNALQEGDIISMPGDRIFGSQKYVVCNFFGKPAKFPAGPFVIAARKSIPALAVFVMKTSTWKYKIRVCEIGVATTVERRQQVEQLASKFASVLEEILREYPEQWFNYYDFWE